MKIGLEMIISTLASVTLIFKKLLTIEKQERHASIV